MKVTTVHELQALIRGRRTSLKWTQGALARDAGVSRKWVSDFERGVSISVELPQLLRVLSALDLCIDITPTPAANSSAPPAGHQDVDLDEILKQYTSKSN